MGVQHVVGSEVSGFAKGEKTKERKALDGPYPSSFVRNGLRAVTIKGSLISRSFEHQNPRELGIRFNWSRQLQ